MLQDYLDKYEISVPNHFKFSNRNLLIGKNGSGKTRLLKAYRDFYQEDVNKRDGLIYIYFPALSSKYDVAFENVELEETLFDIINYGESMSYDEFVTLFQYTGVSLIKSYLMRLNERGRIIKGNAKKTLQKIENNLKILLNIKLIIKENSSILFEFFNGKQYEITKALEIMSPGELSLFYIALFLSITAEEKSYILMMDEPEMHVHPSVVVDFYKAICNMACIKELWIATHSPLLLQEFSFDEVVLLANGEVQTRNSHLYKNVMREMLGDDQEKISELFYSVEEWEYCNFIAECFKNPTVVEKASKNDEQAVKFVNVCQKLGVGNISILDWGGGAGRLGKCLELIAESTGSLRRYRYEIYEPFYENSMCSTNFTTYTSIKEIPGKYDFVVMMNVLHEIGVAKWIETFQQVKLCLKPGGHLIFAEAKTLRIGEQPNCDNGYLVLGENQIKELFNNSNQTFVYHSLHLDRGKNDKSEFIIIPREELSNITKSNIENALKSLKNEMFEKLKQMDKERISSVKIKALGKEMIPLSFTYRKYAFVVQQYINAVLVLENDINFVDSQTSKMRSKKKKRDYDLMDTPKEDSMGFLNVDDLWGKLQN